MENKNFIVICGPTASGKTALAVKTAEMLSDERDKISFIGENGERENTGSLNEEEKTSAEIISADSRQIYRKMDIGTGKDLSEYITEKYSVPYHCIDIRNADELFTLYDYISEFRKALNLIRDEKRIPILAGGTGLYIETVLKQYHLDRIEPDFELRQKLEKKQTSELKTMLENLNSDIYSRTDLSSRKRIIRGIEKAVYYNRKKEIECLIKVYSNPESISILKDCTDFIGRSNYQRNENPDYFSDISEKEYNASEGGNESREMLDIKPLVLVTRYQREDLVSRIEKRLDQRFDEGMVEEVEKLLDEGISPERMHFLGLEYRYISQYLLGEMNFDQMHEKLFTEIRRFSKRQTTYFKGMERRGIKINYVDNADPEAAFSLVREHFFDL